ncbi:MAG: hypothetical protein II617_05580 [Firmicutes bacterium]|nr:hypothetical protein [Bacillota bacterium]
MLTGYENTLQILVLGACLAVSIVRAVNGQSRVWALLSMFFGAFFLGDLYWGLYILFYGDTPYYSYIPSISWDTSYIFQLLIILHFQRRGVPRHRSVLLWIIPVFTVGMCAVYMTRGDYLTNAFIAVIATYILLYTVNGLLGLRGSGGEDARLRPLYLVTILFWVLEYAMWTVSLRWMGETMANPYYWFDIGLTISFILVIPAVRKAEA